jgi:hypothetical protein
MVHDELLCIALRSMLFERSLLKKRPCFEMFNVCAARSVVLLLWWRRRGRG